MRRLCIIAVAALTIPFHVSCDDPAVESRGPLFAAVHYANPISGISYQQLYDVLQGTITSFDELGGDEMRINLRIDSRIVKRLSRILPYRRMRSIPSEKISGPVADRDIFLICGIDELRPGIKALYIDNMLPWGQRNRDHSLSETDRYPFTIPWIEQFDRNQCVVIVQTGVTAMTRNFISSVEKKRDISVPIRYTWKITSQADCAITSNEVSFLDPCLIPLKDRMSFCSPKKYFAILKRSGFDVIEMTGNHNNDYGIRHNRRTLSMITNNGMIYFGGGRNLRDAAVVKYLTIKGTVFAFVGFNELGPPSAWATRYKPGALRLTKNRFNSLIKEASHKADIVFLSVQWANEDDPEPQDIQIEHFHRAIEMGATIAVSSSAHRAMGVEFYQGRFISYGLGNFLFDQMQTINHRSGLIARHIFYNRRHIQTELIPYLIYDSCQPRIAGRKTRREIFKYVFQYSLGKTFQME